MTEFVFLATSHATGGNTITIRNSLVIGSITPNDCSDTRDLTTVSAKYALTAIPGVVASGPNGEPRVRAGISFPTFSLDNMMPRHPYTGIGAYPASKFCHYVSIYNITTLHNSEFQSKVLCTSVM